MVLVKQYQHQLLHVYLNVLENNAEVIVVEEHAGLALLDRVVMQMGHALLNQHPQLLLHVYLNARINNVVIMAAVEAAVHV